MKNLEPYQGFEQGPIRPPSEAESLLIRVTRNCPWNRCSFCPVYKGTDFSLRPVEHVLRDIDTVQGYVEAIQNAGQSGQLNRRTQLKDRFQPRNRQNLQALHAAYSFVAGNCASIFLQDGNSLIIKPADLLRILRRLKEAFPMVRRITSYARSQTVARISDDNLRAFAGAGLNRIHIGLESGSDTVLKRVNKGTDKETQIKAGRKVKAAGIELSEYVMPGLGGRSRSREHALETADALNRINPDFIRLRPLAMPGDAPLSRQWLDGEFDKLGEVETASELLLFLEHLQAISSTVKSDHILNLFPEVHGTLPRDRDRMLDPIRRFLALPPEDQLLFCIGRRTQRLASLDDLEDPARREGLSRLCKELGATVATMDQVIDSLMHRFV